MDSSACWVAFAGVECNFDENLAIKVSAKNLQHFALHHTNQLSFATPNEARPRRLLRYVPPWAMESAGCVGESGELGDHVAMPVPGLWPRKMPTENVQKHQKSKAIRSKHCIDRTRAWHLLPASFFHTPQKKEKLEWIWIGCSALHSQRWQLRSRLSCCPWFLHHICDFQTAPLVWHSCFIV